MSLLFCSKHFLSPEDKPYRYFALPYSIWDKKNIWLVVDLQIYSAIDEFYWYFLYNQTNSINLHYREGVN